jgi:septal ring factor EnvC (AmiA/AmiB activator)
MTDVKDCEELTDRIAYLEARNEELAAALRCVSVPADVKAMQEKIAALEARVEVLTKAAESDQRDQRDRLVRAVVDAVLFHGEDSPEAGLARHGLMQFGTILRCGTVAAGLKR